MSEGIKEVAKKSSVEVGPLAMKVWDIRFSREQIFIPARRGRAGIDLHRTLNYGDDICWLEGLAGRYRNDLGRAAIGNLSEFPLSIEGVRGRADWILVTGSVVYIKEFKWAPYGLPDSPIDEDVIQTSLYGLAARKEFSGKRISASLVYFHGGSQFMEAGIRTFKFLRQYELFGIANAALGWN